MAIVALAAACSRRAVPVGRAVPSEDQPLRLLSSPDFLNADVADLARGPGRWTRAARRRHQRLLPSCPRPDPRRLAGAVSRRRAGRRGPGHGRWGRDDRRVGDLRAGAHRAAAEAAVRRARGPTTRQWLERFRRRAASRCSPRPVTTSTATTTGPGQQRLSLARTFANAVRRALHHDRSSGRCGSPTSPRSARARTASAWRPRADVQVVVDRRLRHRAEGARTRSSPAHSAVAQDGAPAGPRGRGDVRSSASHPDPGPVRSRGSSTAAVRARPPVRAVEGLPQARRRRLPVRGGARRHRHRAGRVAAHARRRVPFGLTNYALLDFYPDRLEVTLNDYRLRLEDAKDGAGCGRRSGKA